MTKEEFCKWFDELHSPYADGRDTYEYMEKIHRRKFGFRKYRNYATFKVTHHRYKKELFEKAVNKFK